MSVAHRPRRSKSERKRERGRERKNEWKNERKRKSEKKRERERGSDRSYNYLEVAPLSLPHSPDAFDAT